MTATLTVEEVRQQADELLKAARQSVTLAKREYVSKEEGIFCQDSSPQITLRFTPADNQYSVAHGPDVLYQGPDAQRAVFAYQNADNPTWNRLPMAYRLGNQQIDKSMTVVAIGWVILDCLKAFAANLGSEVDTMSVEHEDTDRREWSVRFTMDGDSMKAGGIYVPGGVVMTWWK